MPVIVQHGICNGKPATISIVVANDLYNKYNKMKPYKIDNPIPANFFKEYLRTNRIDFEEIESPIFSFSTEPYRIVVGKTAEFIAAEDIKNSLIGRGIKYNDFIDKYAEHLKLV